MTLIGNIASINDAVLTGNIAGIKGDTGVGIASITENDDYTITIALTDGSTFTTDPIAGFTSIVVNDSGNLVVTKTDGTTVTLDIGLSEYQTAIEGYKEDSETSATSAKNDALKAEGYSVGKQNGSDVESGEYYHNNSKYYSQQASASATAAATSASNASASETAVSGVKTQLQNRMVAIETEQSVQESRMDTFVALEQGSTTGDAELQDIRVGANGTTYPTAGDAIRGQVSDLKSDLNNISSLPITETAGYYNANGTIASASDTSLEVYTNRIPISEGEKLKITVDLATTAKQWACYCVWRENGTCIGRTVIENAADNKNHYSVVVTAPADAYEISFAYRTYGTHTTTIQYMTELYNRVYEDSRKLDKLDFSEELKCNYSIGSFHSTTGDLYDGTTAYLRDERFIYMPEGTTVTFHPIINNTTYDFIVFPYDADGNYISSGKFGTWVQGYPRTYSAPAGAKFIRVTLRYDDNRTMSSSDYAVFADAVTFNLVSGEQNIVDMVQEAKELAGYKYLPSYWETYLNSKESDIVDAINSVGNHGDYFSFFTDYHVTTNAKHTSAICKWLSEKVNLKKVVCGGDILKTHTHDDALALLQEYRDDFSDLDLLTLYGNHDRNIYADGSGYDHTTYFSLTFDEVYNSLFKRNELVADLSMVNDGYYSVSNSAQKIEYIFLNTGDVQRHIIDDSAQYEWLFDKLNNVPDGWYVVVFAHMLYEISGGVPQNAICIEFIKKVLDAYQNKTSGSHNDAIYFDFTNAHGKVACLIGGHIHIDYSVDSDAGYPIILTTCDSRGEDTTLTRTLGTISEQAIDLFFVDTSAKTIETIRLGAGSDRSFTFS